MTWPIPNAHRRDAACEYATEGRVLVADDIYRRPVPRECLGNLACQPLRLRMPDHREPQQLLPSVAENKKCEELLKGNRRNYKEINLRDPVSVVVKEGLRVDDAIEDQLLRVLEPGAIEAALEADREEAHRRDEVLEALRRDLEAARYAADKAFRQYDATDPTNRLVAAELELRWNRALERVTELEGRIEKHASEASTTTPTSPGQFATLPGSMNRVLAPTCVSQLRTIFAVISAPLSDRMCSGTPRMSMTSAMLSRTPKLLMRRATLMARHSRVNSSIRVISRSLRPSWVWASTKS